MTANSTTIDGIPAGQSVWYAKDESLFSTTGTVLVDKFTLYIAYTTGNAATATPSALVEALNAAPPGSAVAETGSSIIVFGGSSTTATAIISETPTLQSVGYTFFLPVAYDIGTYADAANLSASLTSYVISTASINAMTSSISTPPALPTASSSSAASTSVSSLSSTSSTSYSSVSTSASPSGSSTNAAQSSGNSLGPSSTASGTGSANQTTSAPAVSHDATSTRFSTGALIGGTVGGFFGGLILCTLIALLCLRRRPGRKATQHGPEDLSATKSRPRDVSISEKRPMIVGSTDVTGWRKHLPQDKSNDTIARAFKTTFHQARMHVDGFYEAKAGRLSSEQLGHLHPLAFEDSANTWLQAEDSIPILEAVLVRWIVQRVSLRSDSAASLLPPEYTGIPKKSHWHMEQDAHERPLTAEAKKGFPQALSQWRALAGYLYPEPRSDRQFEQHLNHDIDQAVTLFAQAYSPWNVSNQSQANRDESLRNIFRLASDAGIQLFKQPSTFTFDWRDGGSSQGRTVVVTPALVRTLDEHAELLRPAELLIEARHVRLQQE
ncbi:hypothetical protein LTR85_000856 [Meristemomyces frigidus]|nr:hypothetical protein LTR85_000856 [Meristemomyces frigidus]